MKHGPDLNDLSLMQPFVSKTGKIGTSSDSECESREKNKEQKSEKTKLRKNKSQSYCHNMTISVVL
jgi:hypothetical protein